MVTRRRGKGGGSCQQTPEGKWRIRWYTRDGRHPSKTFIYKDDAERYLRRALVDSERMGLDIAPKGATISSLVPDWWATTERSVKPRTAERYLQHTKIIEDRIGDIGLRDLDYDTLQRFVDSLSRDYAPKTVGHCYAVLLLILKDAKRRGKFQKDIPKPIMPKLITPILDVPTRDQVEQLAETSDSRVHIAVILAGYGGLRQGEVLALSRNDVNLDEGWLFVHQARNKSSGKMESTKTGNARRVYLPARAVQCLRDHLDEHPGEFVVPVTASIFDKSWNSARLQAGLGGVRFHDLRHAAASMMIHAGWSVTQVAKQLGHRDPAMTLRTYSHLWPDSYADAIGKLNEYLDHD